MKRSTILILPLLVTFAGADTFAQVTGGQAPPASTNPAPPPQPEDIEVPPPLLVQISLLPAKPGGRDLLNMSLDSTQTFKTRQYVCDKARVEYVRLAKRQGSRGKIKVVATAGLSTEWFAQRLHLTIGLYDGDKQLKSEVWKVRIGHDNFASSMLMIGSATSKTRDLEVELTPQELADLFADGHAPTVKVTVAIDS
jgi:hypothetical protein